MWTTSGGDAETPRCPFGRSQKGLPEGKCFRLLCLGGRCILWSAKCTVCDPQNATVFSTSPLPAVIRDVDLPLRSVTHGTHILRPAECRPRDKLLVPVVEAEVNSEQLITDAIGGIVAVPKMRSLEVFSTRVPAPKQRSIEGHATPRKRGARRVAPCPSHVAR